MTDLATAPSRPRTSDVAGVRAGLWRVLSLLLVIAAAVVVLVWILQSRRASDLAAENSRTLDIAAVDVFVDGLPLPPGARIAVLGLDDVPAALVDDATIGTSVDLPSNVPAMVALLDDTTAVHGLKLVSREGERDQVVITPTSTAHALLALSPAFLDTDIELTRQRIESIEQDPATARLVDAVADSPNLSVPNPAVEDALASILDRVQLSAMADQGCDSLLNARAVAVAGTCAEPTGNDVTIHNEQNRWVLAFAGPEPYTELCAVIAPAGTPGSQRSLSSSDCGSDALLTAPGPVVDRSADRTVVNAHIRDAAALQLFASHVAPLLDLTGGAAGLNRPSNTQIIRTADTIVTASIRLATTDPGFASAIDVLNSAATPVERHAATIAATRALVAEGEAIIDDWTPTTSTHLQLLDFYDRVGEQMLVEDRAEWRWTADAWGLVDLDQDR